MKTEILNSPEMRKLYLRSTYEHELAIACGKNAFDNLKTSLAHAKALIESRRFDAVVYVNIPFSARRFTDTRREVFPKSENNPAFAVIHALQGSLGREFYLVEQTVKQLKGKVAVIINSWEMASSCYRYKEQLLFAIHNLVCADAVTVIVYSQAKAGSVEPGVIHRAGLGRLPAFAMGVMEIPEEDRSAGVSPATSELAAKPKDADGTSALQYIEDILPSKKRESAQLHGSKINKLRYADLVKEAELEEMAVAA